MLTPDGSGGSTEDPSNPDAAPETLLIKANINSEGKKLYHLPTWLSHQATEIEES